jgi:drug/metabolite transporter (DMT)-like permease
LTASGEFWSLACAILWAVAVIFFRKSGERVSPVALNVFKNTVGLTLFLVTLPLLAIPFFPEDQPASHWAALLLSGVIGIGIADTLLFACLNRLGATGTAIVDCLYSPFVILMAALFLDEPVGSALFLAVLLMVGAILLGTWEPDEKARMPVGGLVLGVLAMFFTAAGIVLAKPVLATADPWWATTVRLSGGMVPLAIQATLRRHRAQVARCFRPGPAWRHLLPGAVIGSYVAVITWLVGMKYTSAGIASVLNQTSSIFVMLLAALFLSERLTIRKVAGILLGFVGAAVVAL